MTRRMVILGLTGSIGMGKSTAAGMLRRLGVAVHDSDRAVHRLLAKGGAAVPAIRAVFPGTVEDDAVNRPKLGARVFGDPVALARLEAILHPLVHAEIRRFLQRMARRRAPLVALDVPLLFETGSDRACDATLCVTAPPFVQRQRVLRRKGMTAERLANILARQLPDLEKRRRADFVVRTGVGRRPALLQLAAVVRLLRHCSGRRWTPKGYPHA